MNLLCSLIFAIMLAFPAMAAETHPGGINHDLQVNNNGYFGGVSPINGDCLVGSGGAWIAGSCASGSGTVTSSGSPVSGNIPKFTTSTNIAPAAAADIVALFSTCSGTQYLGADGACHTAGGTGTVTTTGSPASGNLTKFSGATSVTNADITGDCTTSGTLSLTCTKTNSVVFATSATTDTTNATNITTGTLPLAQLPKLSRLINTSYVMSNYGGL